jgi:hypothetical protein
MPREPSSREQVVQLSGRARAAGWWIDDVPHHEGGNQRPRPIVPGDRLSERFVDRALEAVRVELRDPSEILFKDRLGSAGVP